MTGFKFISMIFPFIREMILGEKTLAQAVKTNKLKVLLLLLIMGSFLLNFFTLPKLFAISDRYVHLRDSYVQLEKETKSLREDNNRIKAASAKPIEHRPVVPPTPPATTPDTPPSVIEEPEPPRTKPHVVPDPALHGYDRVQKSYDQSVKRSRQKPRQPIPQPYTPAPNADQMWQDNFNQIQNQEDHMYRHGSTSTQR